MKLAVELGKLAKGRLSISSLKAVALRDYATPEQLNLFREQMGLNLPLWHQYFDFLWNMLTLDFG